MLLNTSGMTGADITPGTCVNSNMLIQHYYNSTCNSVQHNSLYRCPSKINNAQTFHVHAGLFDDVDSLQKKAFLYATREVNRRNLLGSGTRLEPVIATVPQHDSFAASKKVCNILSSGVAAIFGPQSIESSSVVQSICDAMEVPHLETRWNYRMLRDDYSVNLYPFYTTLSRAFIDLVKYWKWGSMTVLYEDNEGLVRLKDLLSVPTAADEPIHITVRSLKSVIRQDEEEDYRPILKEIKQRKEQHVVIDCDATKVYTIFKQAQQIGMMTHYYHYLLTSLDVHTLDLSEFMYGGTNITAFTLVDYVSAFNPPKISKVARMRMGLNERRQIRVLDDVAQEEIKNKISPLLTDGMGIRIETALVYDAVFLFVQALVEFDKVQSMDISPLSCSKKESWGYGSSLVNYMKLVDMVGLSGDIRFDEDSRRTNFHLDVVELTTNGLEVIGEWNITNGVRITKNYSMVIENLKESLQGKVLEVTSILEPPYLMLKNSKDKTYVGNDRFEGYCVDLLKAISKEINFSYSIHIVEDGKYGAPDSEGNWNGMIRELMDHKADLAVAPLTITYIREEVIDFTKPYMNLGISILFKKPEKKDPKLFSFLEPLSLSVWMYMILAYLGVSFILFVLARFSPYEWYNPHPCNQDSDIVQNQFSILNSLWFTVGSLMQQGSEIMPRAMSTRMVSGIWWFFTLIMISSYTANLAAFLTVERMVTPIENADDLSKQTDIRYGCQDSGSTKLFFKNSRIPTYEQMWAFMSGNPDVFCNTSEHGVQRVKAGKYAYLMESTMVEYVIQRDCDLQQVGGLLDTKGYGIGTPKGSMLRDLVSSAILQLQESSDLHLIKDKWWKHMAGGGCSETEDQKKQEANELDLTTLGGVFVLLIGGLFMAIIVGIVEFIWKARQFADEDEKTLCSELVQQMKFAIACKGSKDRVPPLRKRPSVEKFLDKNGIPPNALTLAAMQYSPRDSVHVPSLHIGHSRDIM